MVTPGGRRPVAPAAQIDEEASRDKWEPAGRHREFLDADRDLRRCLGISMGATSPIDATASCRPTTWRATSCRRDIGARRGPGEWALIGADRAGS